MKIVKPPDWKEVSINPDLWPDEEMRSKLSYVDCGLRTIYSRDKGWTRLPVIKQLIRKHELGHVIQYIMTGTTWHVDESGIMSRRGSLPWLMSPIVSLFRWDWHSKSMRELIAKYNSNQ